jgi:hypothetical protein
MHYWQVPRDAVLEESCGARRSSARKEVRGGVKIEGRVVKIKRGVVKKKGGVKIEGGG